MSPRKKENKVLHLLKLIVSFPLNLIGYIVNFVWKKSINIIKQLLPKRHKAKAGFVLPTVVMIIVVVVLLTTAIFIRSFDRAKNASNYRIEQGVLNASTPALERAKAKIDQLLNNDKTLPRGTPSDVSIRDALSNAKYTFGDETQLTLVYDIDKNSKTDLQGNKNLQGDTYTTPKKITDEEIVKTAWKFPYDSDNNGKFDSFTLYSIVYRNPPLNTGISPLTYTRKRTPMEARALPAPDGLQGCGTAGSENSIVAGSDWLKVGGKFKKAFYVYVANVPITSLNASTALSSSKYEVFKNKSVFSGLEMAIEPSRIPLNNNAVWFDNDIEISNAGDFSINGRVHTNGNLMVAGRTDTQKVHFYLISSVDSCHYKEPENSQITVGGEMSDGDVRSTIDRGLVRVHLYRPDVTTGSGDATTVTSVPTNDNTTIRGTKVVETTTGTTTPIDTRGKTTTATGGSTVGYNPNAYAQRIGLMVDGAMNLWATSSTRIPPTVITKAQARQDNGENQDIARRKELETFFKERTRRVPYNEVPYQNTNTVALYKPGTTTPYVSTPTTDANFIFTGTAEIRPPLQWMLPFNTDGTSNTTLAIRPDGTDKMYLQAIDPDDINASSDKKQYRLGDRILVGNGLPKNWPDYTGSTDTSLTKQFIKNGTNDVKWLNTSGTAKADKNRYRESQIEFLDDLGDLSRGGFWEQAAAKVLTGDDNPGGLRIVTGAGIYAHNITSGTYDGGLLDSGAYPSFLPSISSYYGGNLEGSTPTNPNPIPALPTGLQATSGQVYNLVWSDQMPMSTPVAADQNKAPDLRMRATAVYHYRNSLGQDQVPLACVSSYYDPSTSTTAKNGNYNSGGPAFPWSSTATTNLPYNYGAGGRSNNGVVYPSPYSSPAGRTTYLTASVVNELKEQARLMFPNGRIVNRPLQDAMIKLTVNTNNPSTPIVEGVDQLNMADYSAIDAEVCALGILTGSLQPIANPTTIDHGAIKEAAFLNARQVKSLQQNLTSGSYSNLQIEENRADYNDRYNLPLEQRQPLEIRVTELDMNLLRTRSVTNVTGSAYNTTTYSAFTTPGYQSNDEEFLLPNSGVIYVARNDALMDLSAATTIGGGTETTNTTYNPSTTQLLQSRADIELDPTRRPNGVRLINGANLSRKDFYRYAEKGLILATDLPLYVEGDFNLHVSPDGTKERDEFVNNSDATKASLKSDWTNFYQRNTSGSDTLNANFACVKGQTSTCTEGDRWRPATLLSDSVTLLSSNFRDGFRNEGDYDLRNNIGNVADQNVSGNDRRRGHLLNGFWFNNFVTSFSWIDNSATNPTNYPQDFDTATGTQGSSYLTNGVTPIQRRVDGFPEYLMEYCPKLPLSECKSSDWVINSDGTKASGVIGKSFDRGPDGNNGTTADNGTNYYLAGTTATPPNASVARFPRRIAFKRTGKRLVLESWDKTTTPTAIGTKPVAVPIGINSDGFIDEFHYNTYPKGTLDTSGNTDKESIRNGNDALWYITTNSIYDDASANLVYRSDKPLAFDLTSITVGAQTTDIPGLNLSLNDPDGDPASGYLVCSAGNSTSATETKINIGQESDLDIADCPSNVETQISNFRKSLLNYSGAPANQIPAVVLPDPSTTGDNIVRPLYSQNGGTTFTTTATTTASNYTLPPVTAAQGANGVIFKSNDDAAANSAQPVVNVIEINDGAYPLSSTCSPVKLQGNDNSIFIIRSVYNASAIKFPNTDAATACGFKMELDGVDPNNVFIALGGNLAFNEVAPSKPHQIYGTLLIDENGNPDWKTLTVPGGRVLGGNKTGAMTPGVTKITAIASDGQPRSYPMLQIHNPIGTPNTTNSAAFDGTFNSGDGLKWVQGNNLPEKATYNAIFVTGNVPSVPVLSGAAGTNSTRAICPYSVAAGTSPDNDQVLGNCGETGGGLNNFVRFQEYWNSSDTTSVINNLQIQGSFIEARQSYYDTAPYISVDPLEGITNNTGSGARSLFGYTLDSSNKPTYNANGVREGFRYRGGAEANRAPYFTAPKRAWGYDVGLLNASPDLFSQRFTNPPSGEPNKSFRQVGRDDPWVQSLLCATQMPVNSSNVPSPTGTTKTGYDDSRSGVDVLGAYGTNYTFALSQDQRPTRCPVCWGNNCP